MNKTTTSPRITVTKARHVRIECGSTIYLLEMRYSRIRDYCRYTGQIIDHKLGIYLDMRESQAAQLLTELLPTFANGGRHYQHYLNLRIPE